MKRLFLLLRSSRGDIVKENIITGLVSAAIAAITAYLKIISVPFIVLIIAMVIDYATGMSAAYISSELSSKTGIKGVLKKLGYIALVCVGIIVDYIISSSLSHIGISMPADLIFGLIITIWLIINELISILENLGRLGVPVPDFIMKLINRLKITVESKADSDSTEKTK